MAAAAARRRGNGRLAALAVISTRYKSGKWDWQTAIVKGKSQEALAERVIIHASVVSPPNRVCAAAGCGRPAARLIITMCKDADSYANEHKIDRYRAMAILSIGLTTPAPSAASSLRAVDTIQAACAGTRDPLDLFISCERHCGVSACSEALGRRFTMRLDVLRGRVASDPPPRRNVCSVCLRLSATHAKAVACTSCSPTHWVCGDEKCATATPCPQLGTQPLAPAAP
jgi:hypothetical protein